MTTQTARRAGAELAAMKGSLRRWLKLRAKNDARPDPTRRARRLSSEQEIATNLHGLLAETFDPASLPVPDVAANPEAAAQLARVAIAGRLPTQQPQQEMGLSWVWPVVVLVGAGALVWMYRIRSDADLAARREELECIKAGACTDSGFWLKVGVVGVIGWVLWSHMGLGAKVKGVLAKGG